MKKLLYFLTVLLTLVLVSCAGLKNSVVSSELYENKWVLKMGNSDPKNNEIYLIFDKESSRFGGFGGCSSIAGECLIIKGFIRFSKIFSNKQHCSENNDDESAFISLLEEADQVRIERGKLYLYKEKMLLLSFEKQVFK